MISIVATLAVLILGVSGLAVASDSSRPGDKLFGIDQAVEKIQLSLTGQEKKDEFRMEIAGERLDEVGEIIDESSDTENSGSDTLIKEENLTEIEADVFTNETIVKIEALDIQKIFITSAKTKEEIIEAISQEFGFSAEIVGKLLVVEIEDRESRNDDKEIRGQSSMSDVEKEKILKGIYLAGSVLAEIKGDISNETAKAKLQEVIDKFNKQIESLSGEIEIELENKEDTDDGESESKIKIKSEDGVKMEIKEKTTIKSDDSKSNGDDTDKSMSDDSSQGGIEIEADVFTDITTIKVEINDEKTFFTTKSKTPEAITNDILEKFGNLNESQVVAILEIEIENRASKPEDLE